MKIEDLRALRKKRRLTKEEKASYILLWQVSGLSKADFCRQEEIAPSTFITWFSEHKARAQDETEDKFVPIVLDARTAINIPEPEKQLKIQLSNGTMIEGSFKREELALWLKEVKNGLTSLC